MEFFSEKSVMLKMKPGILFWGGTRTDPVTGEQVSGWKHNQCYPDTVADMWEDEIGFDGSHVIHLRASYDMRGVDRAIDLADRIIKGGGIVQVGIYQTPLKLASIDPTIMENGRPLYRLKPPSDYKAWARLYVRIVMRFLRRIPADKIRFNMWLEPHRYMWRDTDEEFFVFYNVVQTMLKQVLAKAVKLGDPKFDNFLGVQVGGIMLSDMVDAQLEGIPGMTDTPALEWMRKFFVEAKRNDWQVDFWDCFQFRSDVDIVIDLILGVQDLLDELRLEIPLLYNSVSNCGWLIENNPINGEELDAEYRFELLRKIHKRTDVAYANYDVAEDYSDPGNSRYHPCGMVEYGTLRKRKAWYMAKMITKKKLLSDDGQVDMRIE